MDSECDLNKLRGLITQKKRNFENMMTVRHLGTRCKESCDRDLQRMREEIKQIEEQLDGN
jgi:hypothetical protein